MPWPMALRLPATRMGAIVKGERSMTADTALRLARFFDASPELWINLQAMHDLTKAMLERGVLRRAGGADSRGGWVYRSWRMPDSEPS